MAGLTGHFSVDFSDFTKALDQAEVKLKGFDASASRVGASLNRMAESFSGNKIRQDAETMIKAIGGVEGVSRLTATEQARVNTLITEAIAKYRALGIEAPADLQKVSTELQRQQIGFKELATAAAAVGGIVAGVSAGIGKLGTIGADVNDVSDQFRNLTAAVGESSTAILDKLRTATLGTISDFELMKTANEAMSQGLSLTAEQFGQMGDTAAVLSDRLGIDAKQAFDTLSQAMATGQDRTLKTIGLNIDAEAATARYAASIGKSVKDLDESERKHAIQNAILAEGQRIISLSGKAQEDFGDKVSQSSTRLSNFVDNVGAWVATSPSIGAWTSTITAASSTVTAFGLAMGPISAGISKLIPLLGLSGIGGAFASLGTIITATVIPALGTALAALAPFLLPLAALAAAIGAVYAAWRNWDAITGFVKGVYEGVKTWMGEKLGAVFDWAMGKINAVTSTFKNMYDKVVGNSYVPDMIAGIATEFGRLGEVMVNPAQAATDRVSALFEQGAVRVGNIFGGQNSMLGRLLTTGLSSLFGGPLMQIVSQGVGALVNIAWEGAKKIGSFFSGLFGGGEEGTKVNPARDQWFAGRSVQDIGNALAPFMDGESARKMIEGVFNAKTDKDFKAKSGAIDKILKGSFAGGTGGRYLDFGAGTPVMLHGKERVMTEAEGRQEGGVSLVEEFQSLRREMARRDRMAPRIMAMALKDAITH